MELITGGVEERITALKAQSLDELWHEAEGLGRVCVKRDYSDKTYEAEIIFYRKSGTRIDAVGKDQNAAFALASAINEAREMGA